ncbi:MAG: aspartate-semialdehyde dehydrogenase [Actinobacteria bacterium]|uniref:aspartate-semialdehyde dehydrogenase n=1 Tax=Phycicoccus elongatus Lp2 TaxID=1193181 RepID=N0DYQ0_9MICO|nr:aspartate-semialdehyde dehydrogenase [Phycicoccus elongatus]MCA0321887.1 aspartate-semialdehyde dehydrogenase [Actinomycetota bacterium]CCH68481.1 Aspartate-semialdehyde dehydrogenase [Phycicoccus elongatus Lp2]
MTLAVVGATGAVGRVLLQVLPTRAVVWDRVKLAASSEDVGQTITVGGRDLVVEALTEEFFDGVDVAVVDIPPPVVDHWVRYAAGRGVVVIDNSPVFRGDPEVPLVATEVNPQRAKDRPLGIIANPGATVMTMIDALATLHAGWQLEELVVTTLQAASGLGRKGIARLYDEIEVVSGDRTLGQRPGDIRRLIEHELGESVFPGPLAMNVLPMVGHLADDGWTSEEVKVREETRRILGLPGLRVSATCVRVPVVSSHSINVHARFANRIDVGKARQALVECPAVVVLDDPEHAEFPTPNDVVGADPRFAGRIRQMADLPQTLDLFLSGDNLRKGAALNMLQTAELIRAELLA